MCKEKESNGTHVGSPMMELRTITPRGREYVPDLDSTSMRLSCTCRPVRLSTYPTHRLRAGRRLECEVTLTGASGTVPEQLVAIDVFVSSIGQSDKNCTERVPMQLNDM